MLNFDDVKRKMLQNENNLSSLACKSEEAIRFEIENSDIRCEFAKDADRIVHTLSYTRYTDKTQVYTNSLNDNISKRMTHVQFVSRTSRTIARALGLNEDLCEAIALGHDIGHTPFGHVGEKILNDISLEKLGICFAHNLNSVRVLTKLEKNGTGCNLTLQVLDGIMCHNGEMVKSKYTPTRKNIEIFKNEYEKCSIEEKAIKNIRPMTMEGCVVRISDIIGYIGKDIEDAIRLGKLDESIIPESIVKKLGITNASIMNNIILDIIDESFEKPYIQMSNSMYEEVVKLKEFNYKNIYYKANDDKDLEKYRKIFYLLYDIYVNDINSQNKTSSIYTLFLNNMCEEYLVTTKKEQMVIDYISGMTDNFIQKEYEKNINIK